MTWMDHYKQVKEQLWSGRTDSDQNDRYHLNIQCKNLAQLDNAPQTVALLGFCSDEGVKRNHGRVGAAEGPQAIRRALCNLPTHRNDLTLYDCGDIICIDNDLEAAQRALASAVSELVSKHIFPIVLGGGHETAWGHYQGLAAHYDDVAICNFDAHFDLRDLIDESLGSSGTPFWQIYHHCRKEDLNYDYTCLGVQLTANTQSLFRRADDLGVNYVLADELHCGNTEEFAQPIERLITQDNPIYVSFCLDVLSASVAPGVSAPQPAGLYLAQVIPLLRSLAASGKVCAFDIVELAPQYDNNEMTAKSAAVLISDWIHHLKVTAR